MLSPMNGDTPLFESEPKPPLTPPSEEQPALTPADVPPAERERPTRHLAKLQELSKNAELPETDKIAVDDALSRVEIARLHRYSGRCWKLPRQGRPRRGRNPVRVSQAQEGPQDGEGPQGLSDVEDPSRMTTG
jgi:hypothetical protein